MPGIVQNSGADILRGLSQAEFRAGLIAARRRRDESALVAAEYDAWFERLEPYLASDPACTIDEALRSYEADRRVRVETGERSATP